MEPSPTEDVAATTEPTPEPRPDSSTIKEMSAAETVINTVELLDEILDHVPPKKIFLLQRINKTLHNHIRGDTRTARRLHLTPGLHGQQTILATVFYDTFWDMQGPLY